MSYGRRSIKEYRHWNPTLSCAQVKLFLDEKRAPFTNYKINIFNIWELKK